MSGALYCDVKQLHKMLMMELNTVQGPSLAGHHQGILEVRQSRSMRDAMLHLFSLTVGGAQGASCGSA